MSADRFTVLVTDNVSAECFTCLLEDLNDQKVAYASGARVMGVAATRLASALERWAAKGEDAS